MASLVWESVAGNKEAFDQLVRLVASGKATAFVGAGASAELYPLWDELLAELADRACVSIDEPDRDAVKRYWAKLARSRPDQAAQQMKELLRDRYYKLLHQHFDRKKTPRSTAVHQCLARLPFRAFVTLNYDLGLSLAGAGDGHPPFTWQCDTNIPLWLRGDLEDTVPVLHAHGMITDRKSIVLDQESYRQAYQCEPYLDLMSRLWTGGRLVIVGFGFGDPWLRMTVDRMIERSGGREITGPGHFAIIGLAEEELATARFHRQEVEDTYHGQAVFYPVRGDDHSALQALLEELARRVAPAPAKKPKTTRSPSTSAVEERWRAAVRRQHRRLHNPLDLPSGMQELEEAFVAIDVQGEMLGGYEAHKRGAEGLRLADLLALDPAAAEGVSGRWLLTGDPGAGKTTLLRKLALELAAEPAGGRLPVFCALSEAIDGGRFLLDQVAHRFETTDGVPGLAALLEAAGHAGRLVLLLDGLDEVAPEQHAKVKELTSALAERFPEATMVVSTRHHGRSDLEGDFVDIVVLPLADDSRAAFLEKWFRHQGADDPAAACQRAVAHFDRDSSLDKLSRVPLFLTLLAGMWDPAAPPPGRSNALFERIFDYLYEGRHRERRRPIASHDAAHRALAFLAHGMTVDEVPAATRDELESRLLTADEDLRGPLLATWPDGLWAFLEDVWERTSIIGPRDGDSDGHPAGPRPSGMARKDQPWRFWHRTFREYLTAEHLREIYQAHGVEEVLVRVDALAGAPGRWAEPFVFLAGQLPEEAANRLLQRVTVDSPSVARRSLETASKLSQETLEKVLAAGGDWEAKRQIFEAIPEQLTDPHQALDMIRGLCHKTRNGNDLFFLDQAAATVGEKHENARQEAEAIRQALFDHIPLPARIGESLGMFETLDGERKPLWCEVPAGRGVIGSQPEESNRENERPRHTIEVQAPYWLGAVPVTRGQYALFDSGKTYRKWPGIDPAELLLHPATDITWYEAVSFCHCLDRRLGLAGARLPSEEEWEYACRAGTGTAYWSGDKEADLKRVGWYGKGARGTTHRVAALSANPWGLHDMHGNVWEWTVTPWDVKRYLGRTLKSPFAVDPRQPSADLAAAPGLGRVMRGGSFWVDAGDARSAVRRFGDPGFGVDDQGFRVLLPRPPEIIDH